MNLDRTLLRLREADPVRPSDLAALVPDSDRDRIVERITADTRAPKPADPSSTRSPGVRPWRRASVALAAGALVVAGLTVTTTVGLPGTQQGPSAASAAELLQQSATQARGQQPVALTGDERVYTGLVSVLGDGADRVEVSGEWWTAADGDRLHRLRTTTVAAEQLFGVPVGDSSWSRLDRDDPASSGPLLSAPDLASVPTDPGALDRHVDELAATIDPQHPSSRVATITGLLVEPLASAELRGALFDLLALEPSAVNRGRATDRLGRSGVLVEFAGGSLLHDPETTLPLELRGGDVRTFVGPVVVAGDGTEPVGGGLGELLGSAG